MIEIDCKARVNAGAVLLDEKASDWWHEGGPMDTGTLDVSSSDNCVTAQSVGNGDYMEGVRFLGIADDNAAQIRCGFYLTAEDRAQIRQEIRDRQKVPAPVYDKDAYAELTATWVELITQRRAGGAQFFAETVSADEQ